MENKQKSALIAALCAFVMIATLILSFVLSSNLFEQEDTAIVLPSQMEQGKDDNEALDGLAQQNAKKIAHITIDTSNVQAVIRAFTRPQTYTAQISNTLYWDGARATLQCKQYAKNGAYRVEQLQADGTVAAVQLQYNGWIYAWNAGSTSYYKGQAGSFIPEQAAMLPTYESVCELPQEQIVSAELTEVEGEPVIYVTAKQEQNTAEYSISAVTGLLYRAAFSENGIPTRTVEVKVPRLEPPADSLFILPGKTQTIFEMGSIKQ